jgi:response regulator RpfG family c-di-GMP phosphodiesterase
LRELHDIGKIAIPRSILDKLGPLDDDEWSFVRRHTLIGERIAQSAPALTGVATMIRSSHERWDGKGYPDALAARTSRLGRRSSSFASVLGDDQRSRLPAAMSEVQACAELRRNAAIQFSPPLSRRSSRPRGHQSPPARSSTLIIVRHPVRWRRRAPRCRQIRPDWL